MLQQIDGESTEQCEFEWKCSNVRKQSKVILDSYLGSGTQVLGRQVLVGGVADA